MYYLTPEQKRDITHPLKKAALAENAVITLINNLGVATHSDISKLFRPMDSSWDEKTLRVTSAILLHLYETSPLIKRARLRLSEDTEELLRQNATPLKLSKSFEKKLNRSGRFGWVAEAGKAEYVNCLTGWNESKSEIKPPLVLKPHWVFARTLAVEYVSHASTVFAINVAKRLIDTGHLLKNKEGMLIFYTLSAHGLEHARLIHGAEHEGKSNYKQGAKLQRLHRTLANGYLLHAAATSGMPEVWSESSLHSPHRQLGLKGGPGRLVRTDFKVGSHQKKHSDGSSASSSFHPVDGLVVLEERVTGNKVQSFLELVEAERGAKSSGTFLRSLELLQHTGNLNVPMHTTMLTHEGSLKLFEFHVKTLTYVMSSSEFITPLLTACRQFVAGKVPGIEGRADKSIPVFEGSKGFNANTARERWTELLRSIRIVFAPVSVSDTRFLGVTRKALLLEIAMERGDYDKFEA